MRKIISYLIAVSMVITMIPTAVFAAQPADDQQPAAVTEELGSDELQAPEESDLTLDEEEPLDQEEPQEEEGPVFEDLTLQEGEEAQGWKSDDGIHWYYLKSDGLRAMGFVLLGAKYYFDTTNGYMQTGWRNIDGFRYYFDETPLAEGQKPGDPNVKTGIMKTGWMKNYGTNKDTYYFNSNGRMRTGWLADGGHKYYFAANGKMKTGLVKIGEDKYYFSATGIMQTGKKTVNGSTYYFDPTTGKMKTGFVTDGSNKYYYNPTTGKMHKGWLKLGSNKYYFADNGKMQKGMKKIGKSYYYFNTSNGKMTKNAAVKYKKKLYYFYTSGKRTTAKGWFKGSDKKSRYGLGNGVVATGKKTISGITYVFSAKTGICTKSLGDKYDQQIAKISSNTKYLIYVIKSKHQVRIYKGKKKNWTRVYNFTCELGKSTTPTPSGTFTVKGKKQTHDYKLDGENVHWNNGVNFSTKCGFNGFVWSGKYPDGSLVDSRLGGNTSGGRVRVAENNSLWIYNNIPVGTKVIVK